MTFLRSHSSKLKIIYLLDERKKMKNRTKKKRASRAKRAERWEYVHARGCVVSGCPTIDAVKESEEMTAHPSTPSTSN